MVVPMTAIFQVVMLSASLKSRRARPCASVSSEGCQTRVSGKYSRSRGVGGLAGWGFLVWLVAIITVNFKIIGDRSADHCALLLKDSFTIGGNSDCFGAPADI